MHGAPSRRHFRRPLIKSNSAPDTGQEIDMARRFLVRLGRHIWISILEAMTAVATQIDALAAEAFRGIPYRFRRWLARGGMGLVAEAEHVELERVVAIKFLAPEVAELEHMAKRMRREAQDLVSLRHRNLCEVLDLGHNAAGRPYVVMERLYGKTLREELLERKRLPIAEAIEYVAQALDGLERAHRAGIIHRDVKPDNIFVCEPGQDSQRVVKMIDFGMAKNLVKGGIKTAEGSVIGTPTFLSPEQAKSKGVDARTDVYGAGAVLYRLVCGRNPFAYGKPVRDERESAQQLIYLLQAHANETPKPPSEYAPDAGIPRSLEEAILKAIAKRPNDRHQSATAFASVLRKIAESCDVSSTRAERAPQQHQVDVEHEVPTLQLDARGSEKQAEVELEVPTLQLDDAASQDELELPTTLWAPPSATGGELARSERVSKTRLYVRFYAAFILLTLLVTTLVLLVALRKLP